MRKLKPSVAKFAKDSFLMSVANAVSFAGSLVRGFIVPGFISVGAYGSFNFLCSLAPIFLLLGGNSSAPMPVLIPRASAPEDKKDLVRRGLGVVLFSYGGIAILVFLAMAVLYHRLPLWLLLGLPAFLCIFFFQEIGNYFLGIFRARENFHVLSLGSLYFNTSYFALAVGLTYKYGLPGLILSFLLSNLLLAAFYYFRERPGRPTFPAWAKVSGMVSLGFHQNLSTVISGLIAQSDRYVLMLLGGPVMVGFYAIAFQVGQLTSLALSSMVQVLSAKIYRECAKPGDFSRLETIYTVGVFLYSFFSLAAAAVLFFMVGPVLQALLPKYWESIQLARVLVWLPAFQTVSNISAMVIVGTRGIKRLNLLLGVIGAGSLLLHYAAWSYFGLTGVCYSTLFVGFVTCLVHFGMVSVNLKGSLSLLTNFALLSLLIAYGVGTSYGVDIWLQSTQGPIFYSLLSGIKKSGLELLLLAAGYSVFFLFRRSLFDTILKILTPEPKPVPVNSN